MTPTIKPSDTLRRRIIKLDTGSDFSHEARQNDRRNGRYREVFSNHSPVQKRKQRVLGTVG